MKKAALDERLLLHPGPATDLKHQAAGSSRVANQAHRAPNPNTMTHMMGLLPIKKAVPAALLAIPKQAPSLPVRLI